MTNVVAILREPERSTMAFERLANECPGVAVTSVATVDAALPHLADAEILITIGVFLGDRAGAVYAAAPRLRWIQSIGTGTDNLAGHPALSDHVAVTNIRGLHGAQMSEAAIAAMLSLGRDIPRTMRNQAEAYWHRFPAKLLNGGVVGIFGLGSIAEAMAPRLKALGMTVVGISSAVRPAPAFDKVVPRERLADAVAELDWLILLTPYSPATHHVIDGSVFAAMKPGAYLINLARGGIVDERALLAALQAGTIAGAALDVFEQEPLPTGHPFWSAPNLIITPHTAGFHQGYGADVYAAIADNVRRYIGGGPCALQNKVC